MHSDPIADMLNRLKNAAAVKHETVTIPHSRVKEQLAKILVKEGFLQDAHTKRRGARKYIVVSILGKDGLPLFQEIKRISKPSKRTYSKAKDLYPVRNGYGRAILSTPKGLMSNEEARKQNVGGEVFCYIW